MKNNKKIMRVKIDIIYQFMFLSHFEHNLIHVFKNAFGYALLPMLEI